MSADKGNICSRRHATEGNSCWVDVEFGGARRSNMLESGEGVLNADGEGKLGDETVGYIDDADVCLDAEMLADMGFCIEVPKTPA